MRINTHNSFILSGVFHLMFVTLLMLLPKPESLSKIDLSFNLEFIEGYKQIKSEEAIRPSVNKTLNSKNKPIDSKPQKLHKTSNIEAQTTNIAPIASAVSAHYQRDNYAQSDDISTNNGVESKVFRSSAEGEKYTMQAEGLQKDGSEGDVSQILSYLANRIEAFKKYPYLARRKGIEGDVVLLIDIDKGGNLVNARVSKSSGYEILDHSAEMLIKKVFPIKHNLNRDLKLRIPITYRLLR